MKVGDKVVCILGYTTCDVRIVKGEIYTVKAIDTCCAPAIDVGLVSMFGNTVCQCCRKTFKGVFHFAERFRLVDYTYGEEVAERLEKTFQPETIEV